MRQTLPLVVKASSKAIGEVIRDENGTIILATFLPPFDAVFDSFASAFDYEYEEYPTPHVVMTERKPRRRVPLFISREGEEPLRAGTAVVSREGRIFEISLPPERAKGYEFFYDGESVVAKQEGTRNAPESG